MSIQRKILNRFSGYKLDQEELLGVLLESLVLSLDKFDPDRGVSFVTYSYRVMMNNGMRWAKKEVERLEREVYREVDLGMEELSSTTSLSPPPLSELENISYGIFLDYASTTIQTQKQLEIIEAFLKNPKLSRKEIAHEVGVSLSYVKEVIQRYKRKGGQ